MLKRWNNWTSKPALRTQDKFSSFSPKIWNRKAYPLYHRIFISRLLKKGDEQNQYTFPYQIHNMQGWIVRHVLQIFLFDFLFYPLGVREIDCYMCMYMTFSTKSVNIHLIKNLYILNTQELNNQVHCIVWMLHTF